MGVGEASYAPAATPMIGDLFPANKRSRAIGIFVLGLPIGLVLAFFTIGAMVQAFGSWRAPFVIAMIPGDHCLRPACSSFASPRAAPQKETGRRPQDRAADPQGARHSDHVDDHRGGGAFIFAAYAANGFMVPLIQRYFDVPLQTAAAATGVIVGVSGLVGLTLGGRRGGQVARASTSVPA